MPELILFMYPGACSRVTMSALEEAGAEYQQRVINLGGGQQFGADYVAINPKAKVPMLSIDGRLLTENAAILGLLHRMYPAASLLPAAADDVDAASGLSDLIWCASTLHPEVRQVRAPFKLTAGNPEDVRADGMKKFAKEADVISRRVAGGGWWYGSAWSIVDVYLYWAYSTAEKGGFPVADYPELVAHAERVRARPSFQRGLARERKAVEDAQLSIDAAAL